MNKLSEDAFIKAVPFPNQSFVFFLVDELPGINQSELAKKLKL